MPIKVGVANITYKHTWGTSETSSASACGQTPPFQTELPEPSNHIDRYGESHSVELTTCVSSGIPPFPRNYDVTIASTATIGSTTQ